MAKFEINSTDRLKIINIVLDNIANFGFVNINSDKISEISGIPKKIINKYFENDEELVFQSFQVFFEEYFREISLMVKPEVDIKEYLLHIAEYILDPAENKANKDSTVTIDNDKKSKLFIHFYSRSLIDDKYHQVLKMLYENYFNYISERLYDFYKKRKINIDSKIISFKIMSIIEGFFIKKILGYDLFKKDKIKKMCMELISKVI